MKTSQTTIKIAFILSGLFMGIIGYQPLQAQDPGKAVVIEERYAIAYYVDELEWHFYRAKQAFINLNETDAASEVRKAAALMADDAREAREKDQKDIFNSFQELVSLAQKLDKGEVERVGELNRTFSSAHQALASKHRIRAAALYAEKKTEAAGWALEAAANHLAHGAGWVGHKIGQGADATWKGTKAVARAMAKGASFVPKQAVKAMNFVGDETRKLGEAIKSKRDFNKVLRIGDEIQRLTIERKAVNAEYDAQIAKLQAELDKLKK